MSVAVLIGGILVLVALLAWVTLKERAAPVGAVRGEMVLSEAASLLATAVHTQWAREERDRSMEDPYTMPVRWRRKPDVEDHSALIGDRLPDELGRSDNVGSLVQAFLGFRKQRLVLLGKPGTGKTTLALQLLLEVVRHRKPEDPVPVMMTLAEWDIDEHPDMWDWVTTRLERDYEGLLGIAPNAASCLVAAGRVLPVLDGLDEVPAATRPGIVAAINSSIGNGALILTCRTDEFVNAVARSNVVRAALVAESEPLTAPEIADYLYHVVPPSRQAAWAPVLAAIRAKSVGVRALSELCACPLGLWLVRTVVAEDPERDPSALLDCSSGNGPATAADLRGHLLAELVPTLVRRRRPHTAPRQPRRRWVATDFSRFLRTIARGMTRNGATDLLWWRLPELATPRGTRRALRAVVALPAVLVVLAGAIVLNLGNLEVLAGAVLTAGFPITVGWLLTRRGGRVVSLHLQLSGRAVAQGVLFFVTGTIFVLVAFAVLAAVSTTISAGIMNAPRAVSLSVLTRIGDPNFVLPVCLVGALIGVNMMLRRPLPLATVQTARSTYQRDRTSTVVSVVSASAALPLLFVVGLGEGADTGTLVLYTALFLLGIVFSAPVVRSAWLPCAMAARLLAVAGRLPWGLFSFLEDAHRLGLLRRIGPAYQFRHVELQAHLAAEEGQNLRHVPEGEGSSVACRKSIYG